MVRIGNPTHWETRAAKKQGQQGNKCSQTFEIFKASMIRLLLHNMALPRFDHTFEVMIYVAGIGTELI
jgi:hypothetical protein